MEADFWLDVWKRSDIGFHQAEINAHLQEFWDRLGLADGDPVFVPLCGKSRDMLWLRSRGHPVLGVEISPLAVHGFFAENGLVPERRTRGAFESFAVDGLEILRGDFFQLQAADLRGIVGVYDRASLIALPPPMRQRYAEHLLEILPPEAQILLVTMNYPQEQMPGPPFSLTEEEVERLYVARYRVLPLFEKDILQESPRFRARGLQSLRELVYHLRAD